MPQGGAVAPFGINARLALFEINNADFNADSFATEIIPFNTAMTSDSFGFFFLHDCSFLWNLVNK